MEFVHLHTHTKKSPFDGCIELRPLVEKAKRDGMGAVCVTEHHNVASSFSLYAHSQVYQMKPVFGMEINVNHHHVTALAKNEVGLLHLCRLNNIGRRRKTNPQITEEELFRHREGLFLFSGCSKGKIPMLLQDGEVSHALQVAREYQEAFSDDFFLELQHYSSSNRERLHKMVALAKEAKIPVVPTNDCHFLEREEATLYQGVMGLNSGGRIVSINQENYVKTTEEMGNYFPDVLLGVTGRLARQCQVDFSAFLSRLKGEQEMPLSVYRYYDDAEALRKVLNGKKDYKLASFMYKKMKKEGMRLEDLYQDGMLKESIALAYYVRGKIAEITPDLNRYILVNDDFPVWRKNKATPYSVQIEEKEAREAGFVVYDRRKNNTKEPTGNRVIS